MNYRLNLFATTLVFLVVISTDLVPHSASAQLGRISNLTIEADRPNYVGGCPTTIRLTGKFLANEPFGVVRYQFVHSDGTQSAISQLTIDRKDGFTVEETLRKEASWNDTVFLRVFLPVPLRAPMPVDSNRIMVKGTCQEVRAAPRQATTSLGPATGRFRITLNGFTCNHQTAEVNNPLLRDGADDEVFLFTKSFLIEKRADGSGVNVSPPTRRRTPVIGDTSLFPDRTQGGSGRYMGGNGGFRAGDSFPSSPEKRSTNPQAYGLPQLIWEGELSRRQNGIVIIPMIWEWDGIYGLFQAWESAGLDQFSGVGELISDPNLTNQESAKVALRGEVVGQVWMNGRGGGVEPQDRPIGMRSYNGDYRFRPEVLILTYDEALRMANQSQMNGK
ncbi:MAG: hypothetical protein DMF60_02950, partial [Acidobacteria bacterium]